MKVASNWELSAVLSTVGFKHQWLFSSPLSPEQGIIVAYLPACCHMHGAVSSGATACNCGQPPNTNDSRWPCGPTGLSRTPFGRGMDGAEVPVTVLPHGSQGGCPLAGLCWRGTLGFGLGRGSGQSCSDINTRSKHCVSKAQELGDFLKDFVHPFLICSQRSVPRGWAFPGPQNAASY